MSQYELSFLISVTFIILSLSRLLSYLIDWFDLPHWLRHKAIGTLTAYLFIHIFLALTIRFLCLLATMHRQKHSENSTQDLPQGNFDIEETFTGIIISKYENDCVSLK